MDNIINLICLIFILVLIGVSVLNYFRSDRKLFDGQNINTKTEYVWLSIILLLGVFIRIYDFGIVPGGINQDEAMAAVDAKALADYGTDRFGMKYPVHFTAWGFGQMSVLLSYLMVPFLKIGGLNFVTARLPILIISIIALICYYYFFKDLLGNKKALILTAFLCINPWHMMQSRWALDCNMFPHMFVIGMFLLYRSVRVYDLKMGNYKGRIYLYLSMLFFALCMYSYGISFYTVPVFLVVIFIYMLYKKIFKWKNLFISMFIYLLFSWPIYLVMIINMFKINTIETNFFTIPLFEESIRANDILFFSEAPSEQITYNLKALRRVVIFQGKDMPGNSIEGFGILYMCSLPLLILGIIYAVKRNKQSGNIKEKCGFFILFLFLIIGIIAGIITKSVNINRINIIIYPLICFTGLGICFVLEYMKTFRYIIALPYLVLFVMFIHTYFTSYAELIKEKFYGDFDEALYYAGKFDPDKYYITSWISPDANLPHVCEIITMFCHDVDSRYFQGKTDVVDGREVLPYHEKYNYISPDDIVEINPDDKIVYVIGMKHAALFPGSDFYIEEFEGFCTVVPLWMHTDDQIHKK